MLFCGIHFKLHSESANYIKRHLNYKPSICQWEVYYNPIIHRLREMDFRGIGFLLQCYLVLAAAMYFDLGEQEEKCIIEEVPEDTLVTGKSCMGNIPTLCQCFYYYMLLYQGNAICRSTW